MKPVHGLSSIRPKSISRTVTSWQLTPVLLIGKDETFSDVELLLEDNWKNFRYADSPSAGVKLWNDSRADVVIFGASDSDLKPFSFK